MVDNKKAEPSKLVEDAKTAGPKSADSKRTGDVSGDANVAGANADLQNRRMNQFGDVTSSTGDANVPGQHGRDGGEINETENNPAPSKDVIEGERADDTNKEG